MQVQTLRERHRFDVRGVVQGVGFRPFVYGLATDLGLAGVVTNNASGVVIDVEGPPSSLAAFARRLRADAPPLAVVAEVTVEVIAARGGSGFTIGASSDVGSAAASRALVPPDIATCADCLAELCDPRDRRYRHPFISCTNCGPRFTVILDLPYDRPATTMADLPLCRTCADEYADPGDRRFHAQTVACPDCGPALRLHRPGVDAVTGQDAIAETRRLLTAGAVVAIKGIGGYHLACNAADESAVDGLRKRKDRGDKPFAVMVADVATACAIAYADESERALLDDPRRPVVLLRRRADPEVVLADGVSPSHPDIGIMLCYTAVHRLLFGLAGDDPSPRALVMTSGNVSGEPIVTDDDQAIERLAQLVDAWLIHDRAIHVPCDDSVVRVQGGRTLPVRRSRGYAPLPVTLPIPVVPALAVGGDVKNTFCVASGGRAWMSAHIGDMDDVATQAAFSGAVDHLTRLTGITPQLIVADRHPRYRSSAWARQHADGREVRLVQHHHAHIASAMADNGHDGAAPVIGFAFDGTGYGDDGASWGGETLIADYDGFERAAHLRYVALPGGDAGVRNPCRMALSHLHSAGVDWDPRLPSVAACSSQERDVLARQLQTGFQAGPTSSMGRLFDAMSSLAGVCHRVQYEAEAAMRFEQIAVDALAGSGPAYAFGLGDSVMGPDSEGPVLVDPGPVIVSAAADVLGGVDAAVVSARFHRGVADLVRDLARLVRLRTGLQSVALSGGVFLNALLTDLCERALTADGFRVLGHHQVPPSDAGLALGQLAIAARQNTDPSEHNSKRRTYPSCV